jgi:hypothetical protein
MSHRAVELNFLSTLASSNLAPDCSLWSAKASLVPDRQQEHPPAYPILQSLTLSVIAHVPRPWPTGPGRGALCGRWLCRVSGVSRDTTGV